MNPGYRYAKEYESTGILRLSLARLLYVIHPASSVLSLRGTLRLHWMLLNRLIAITRMRKKRCQLR